MSVMPDSCSRAAGARRPPFLTTPAISSSRRARTSPRLKLAGRSGLEGTAPRARWSAAAFALPLLELRRTRSDPTAGGDVVPDLPLDAQVWRDREGVRRAFGYTTEGQHWIHLPGVPASFRFTSSGNGVEGFAARETSVDLIEDAFRRRVVPFALQAAGEELLHASAVETARGAFAFCGASGAGKSTMADSLGSRGYRPLADD